MGNKFEEILKKELVKELVGMDMRNLIIFLFLIWYIKLGEGKHHH